VIVDGANIYVDGDNNNVYVVIIWTGGDAMERFFELGNLLVTPFWLTMILAPRWRVTERLQRWPIGALAPALVYALLVLPRLGEILPVVARPDLGAVAALLATPAGATVAWAHFLAFDLLVGRWIYLDARQRGLSAWISGPLLALTLLLGPLGLLAYLTVRAALPRVRAVAARVADGSTPLVAVAFASLGLLVVGLALMPLDPRQVLGASTWLKPVKFALSVAITGATLAVLLRWLQPVTRGVRRAVALIGWLLALELVIITVQAGRGVPSHFNSATALDGALFTVMGVAITVVWGAIAYLAWRSFRRRFDDRALGWGIRLGLVAMVLGSGLGFIMPRPTAAQLESLKAGRPTPQLGAHAVGVPDGGPGLPVTGWSTEGGDLRVPHFVGMHGLQLLPLAGWFLGRRRDRARAARLTVGAGVGYLGLTAVLLLQALRGQPLIAPDLWTLVTVAGVVAVGLGVALSRPWRRPVPLVENGVPA
jgi:hypothetical protein